MFWFLCALAAVLAALVPVYRNYDKELVQKEKEKGNRLYRLLPMGLALYDRIAPLDPERGEEETRMRELYPEEDAAEKLRLSGAKRVCIFWAGLLAASLLGIAAVLAPASREEVEELPRPDFGETASYRLEVEGLESEPVSVGVTISGTEPDEGGMQELFDEIADSLPADILGDNDSLDEVSHDLLLPTVVDYGIRVTWKSLNPEIISDYGKIKAQDIPEEGLLAILEASLSYSVYRCSYEIPVRVVREEGSAYRLGMLEEELMRLNGENPQAGTVKLPAQFLGSGLTFHRSRSGVFPGLALVLLMLSTFLVIADREKLKEAGEKRKAELLLSYRSLVFELGLMLGCGMTIRGAWYRIIGEYEKKGGEKGYLYKEMLRTKNEIDAGAGEGAAYAAFGHRCGEECYIRLGNTLQQNLQQGVAGLPALLDEELQKALEQQKNQMIKKGELMETKMLLPMFLLLALVMAVLIAPALISI